MRYLLLIYGDEHGRDDVPPEEQGTPMQAWIDYTAWLQEKGWYLGGDALEPTSSATTVRERDGKILTIDGPFAETKEQLGGYYFVQCANLDEAIEAASKIPSVGMGSIEVRPVAEFPEEPS
jgi:hypothetical protein